MDTQFRVIRGSYGTVAVAGNGGSVAVATTPNGALLTPLDARKLADALYAYATHAEK